MTVIKARKGDRDRSGSDREDRIRVIQSNRIGETEGVVREPSMSITTTTTTAQKRNQIVTMREVTVAHRTARLLVRGGGEGIRVVSLTMKRIHLVVNRARGEGNGLRLDHPMMRQVEMMKSVPRLGEGGRDRADRILVTTSSTDQMRNMTSRFLLAGRVQRRVGGARGEASGIRLMRWRMDQWTKMNPEDGVGRSRHPPVDRAEDRGDRTRLANLRMLLGSAIRAGIRRSARGLRTKCLTLLGISSWMGSPESRKMVRRDRALREVLNRRNRDNHAE
jgi:hypothetical protein